MDINLENVEGIINKLTVDLMIENGKLKEKVQKRECMSRNETLDYMTKLDFALLLKVMEFKKSIKSDEIEEGSTEKNMLDMYVENVKLLTLLLNKRKA